MERKQKMLEFRGKLEKTLASHHLSNEESIKTLVKNQFLRSSPSELDGFAEKIIEKRALEVLKFLDVLRSASGNDSQLLKTNGTLHGNWKVKEDNEEYRVMYREGAQGTPFHTLLVEGDANASVDICLCAGWETALYKKWWPHISFPPFRVSESICLQKVRMGEQICLVRLKLPWPLTDREVIVNYFELECFDDGLVIVLLNSVSDMENIAKWTQGFNNEAKDLVRIDLVGGFVIQKVTSEQTYFRTTATMDIKLDFVPPSLINFISRQLIGGACKLYQKTVDSVAKGEEDYEKALKDPFYVRIREYLYPNNDKFQEPEALHGDNSILFLPEHEKSNTLVDDKSSLSDHHAIEYHKSLGDIIKEEDSQIQVIGESKGYSSTNPTVEQFIANKEKADLNPEVESALGILENAIYMVRRGGFDNQTYSAFGSANQELQVKIATVPGSTSLEDGEVCFQAPKMDNICWDEVDNSVNGIHAFRISPATPAQNSEIFSNNLEDALVSCSSNRTTTEASMTTKDYKQVGCDKLKQKKKHKLLHYFLS